MKSMRCHSDLVIGQVVGLASAEFGLSNMILAAVSIGTVR